MQNTPQAQLNAILDAPIGQPVVLSNLSAFDNVLMTGNASWDNRKQVTDTIVARLRDEYPQTPSGAIYVRAMRTMHDSVRFDACINLSVAGSAVIERFLFAYNGEQLKLLSPKCLNVPSDNESIFSAFPAGVSVEFGKFDALDQFLLKNATRSAVVQKALNLIGGWMQEYPNIACLDINFDGRLINDEILEIKAWFRPSARRDRIYMGGFEILFNNQDKIERITEIGLDEDGKPIN